MYQPADANDGKLSNCCGELIRLDRCTSCGEFTEPQDEEKEEHDRIKNEILKIKKNILNFKLTV